MRQTTAGAAALAGWIGDGAHPVDQSTAERRAEICARCPQNVRRKKVESKLAEGIRIGEEARSGLALRTSRDHELKVCESCGCYLPLKVWVPIQNQTEANFPDNCWVPTERARKASPPPPPMPNLPTASSRVFSICRTGAFGDVILASIVADKLAEFGTVRFSTCDATRSALLGHRSISGFLPEKAECTVNLDNCYEQNPNRWSKDIAEMMIDSANVQLAKFGVRLTKANRVANLRLTPEEIERAEAHFASFEGPFTIMVPKSASWKNRSVRYCDLQAAAKRIPGTVFWGFPGTAPEGTTALPMNSFRDLMAFISKADLVITPDTGPLHVAAAFNRPVVYLTTCNDARLRVSNLTDYITVEPSSVDCAKCGHTICPKNADDPPCTIFDPEKIATAARKMLSAYASESVSAVIPIYQSIDRLKRALDCVVPQVNEVVIAVDQGPIAMSGFSIPSYPIPIRVVPAPHTRLGYGKNCNRVARNCTGSKILFLNDDCYLNPGAVNEMVKVMRGSGKRVGVVGAQLWYADGTIQHGGTTRNRGDIGFGHIDHRKRIPSITKPTAMEAVTFAAALVDRRLFFDVRGFDEEYDCYWEDADFCMKARNAGWTVWYTPHASGIHDESQSTSDMKSRMLQEGAKIFTRKWSNYFNQHPV